MIHGDKPSGYGVTYDKFGRRIEVEYRQCAHCQASWIYQAGSGRRRGWCYHCNGLLCGRAECYKAVCVPFYDAMMENSSKYVFDENSGIFLKK